MIIQILFITIVIICTLLTIKSKKWWIMAICAVVLGLWAFVGIDSIIVFIDYISLLALQHSLWILAIAFLFSLTVSAALWANKQEKADEDAKIKEKRNDAIAKIKVKGFVEDSEIPDKTGWELYIKTLAERLIKSTLNGESFALGISGDWGSGKTTFIKNLQTQMADTCVVVEFNPWICTSSNLVITDFFNTLRSHIPGDEDKLIDDIKKYVGLLSEVEILPKTVALLTDFFLGSKDDSISEIKGSIEEQLNKSKTKYVVFIDDLDRLEHKELFEVLRLIRITASFSNLMYVVTYDRKHIRQMLKANNIEEGDQFVKKIFNTEIVLPELEPYILPQMLLDELARMLGADSKIPDLLSPAILSKNTLNVYRILPYLQNYRDVKRFAMAFVADLSNIEKMSPEEYSFEDFFWLEILRYDDYDTYNELRTYPSNLLEEQGLYLVLKKDLNEEFCKQSSKDLLKQLFSTEVNKRSANSICYRNNFRNYFSFRVQDDRVSHKEFNQLLASQADTFNGVLQDYQNENKIMSLYELIRQTRMQELADDDSRKNYLTLLIKLMAYMNKYYINVVCEKLAVSNFYGLDKEVFASHTKGIITQMINEKWIKRGQISSLLTSLHSDFYYDQSDEESGRYNYQSIIEDDFLIAESNRNMQTVFSLAKRDIDICEITKYGSILRNVLEVSTKIYSTDISCDPVISSYRCLPYDAILAYFKQHKSEKLDKFMEPVMFDEDEVSYYDDQECFESKITTIEKIVGSMYNFKKLITECFTNSDDEKKKWIEYWKLS